MKSEKQYSFEVRDDYSNIARVLKASKIAIDEGDWMKLKKLSNETIHSATVHQDSANIVIAVLVYSVSKVLQREHYRNMDGWNDFISSLKKNWDLMISAVDKKDFDGMVKFAGEVRHILNSIDGNLGSYIKDIFRKAEINKAFKLYEHGLSAQQTADLLGITLWDLSSYIGQTSINESHLSVSMNEMDRIKVAEDFFG